MSLRFQSIEALRAAIASEPGSIADLVAEALSGLDRTGRALHAVAHVATEDARARAAALLAEAQRGGAASPLLGIPVAHKDLYMRAGWPCGGGS
ncbi:MAG: hypothetical protein JSW68_12005 [Burkholderiales bacterium]|nr:MAG: hypothetical protein JSW68_12005 [Burkholderiales bacterium]